MAAGYTADVGAGFQLAAEARNVDAESDYFRFGLELRGVLPSRTYAREPIDPKLGSYPWPQDISQLSALAVPCVRWRYLLGCGVAEIGAVIRQDEVDLASQLVVRFGPRLGLEVPFAERFAVRAFGEVLFAAVRGGFGYLPYPGETGPNVFWDPPITSGFFGVGLSVKFE